MKTDWRMFVLVAAAIAALALTVGWTRHVVLGGARTGEGTVEAPLRPGGTLGEGAVTAYHYRVSSRFGEFVQIRVADGEVTVAGRRLDVGAYCFFIGLQMLMWTAAAVLLLAALLYGRWKIAGWAAALFVAYLLASSMMAGGLWETRGAAAMQSPGGFDRVRFPLASVRDVRLDGGWSRDGIRLVIWPFAGGVDGLTKGHEVSFEAPDPVTGRYVVYAMHAYSHADAEALARELAVR